MARTTIPHIITEDSALGGNFDIERSCTFIREDSNYYYRTPSSDSNRKTYTYSCWYKRALLSYSLGNVFEQKQNGQNYQVAFFRDDDKFEFHGYTSTGGNQYTNQIVTTQRFRDVASWYHIIIAVDTTQATASNRVKIYVNGSQITNFDTANYPSQNFDTFINTTQQLRLGMGQAGSSQAYDGYMSEIWHYDGRQLEPTHFGYTESQSEIWRPKKIENPYSTPNNGTTWSNHLTVDTGSISNAANAFNNDVLSFNTSSANGAVITFTPPSGGIEYKNSVRIWLRTDGHKARLNGGTYVFNTGAPTIGQWMYLANGTSGTLQTIDVQYTGGSLSAINAIEVDGIILVDGLNDTDGVGTNGFHLTFRENHNTTAMGYDYSARGNNFSPSSMSVSNSTHNINNDSVTDTPTNNFPTWNILRTVYGGVVVRANLYARTSVYQSYPDHFSTMMMPPGKWYCELYVTGGANGPTVSGGVYLFEDQPASANNYQNSPTTYGTYGGASPGYGNGTLMGLAYDNKLKELINNPAFNYDGDWTKDGSWTIANGKATNSGAGQIYQTIPVVNNKTYLMTVTIDFTGDSSVDNTSIGFIDTGISSYYAQDNSHTANTVNSVSIEWTANLTGNVLARCYSSDSISITKWSVKEVDATVTFYKNGSLYGSTEMTNVPGMKSYCFGAMGYSYNPDTDRKIYYNANFGQKPFSYTPPTGYVALCSKNIANEFVDTTDQSTEGQGSPIIRPQRHFDTLLYSGNGSTQSITDLEFDPDLVWIKMRSHSGDNHHLYDTLRGAAKTIFSNTDGVEQTSDTDRLSSFISNGFTLGNNYRVNGSGRTFVAWCWKAGGAAVTNTVGTISSQVSANDEAGFSIVTYTGDGGGSGSVGTGLRQNQPLGMAIVKRRDAASDWQVGHQGMVDGQERNFAYHCNLNDTTSASGSGPYHMGTQNATLTDRLYLAAGGLTSGANYVAYVWQERPGYSKMGVYRANNSSDGAFFYCGFRPAFIMLKNADNGSAHWYILDNKRNTENECRVSLKSNTADGDVTDSNFIDFLSNGFKLRTSGGYVNGGYDRIFYMAFAEQTGRTEYNLIANAR